MNADAFELLRFAIQKEAVVCIEAKAAYSERRPIFVEQLPAGVNARHHAVKNRIFQSPQGGVWNGWLLHERGSRARANPFLQGGRCDFLSRGIFHRRDQSNQGFFGRIVHGVGLNRHQGFRWLDHGRMDVRPPVRNVYRLGRDQPHMTIDSRPGVPARIGGLAVIHADRYHVGLLAENQVRRQIVFEGGVAVGTVAQMPAVDPDVAVAVYAIEIDKDLAAAFRTGELKCLPVPTDPARQIARAAGIGRGVRAFNRPIMR